LKEKKGLQRASRVEIDVEAHYRRYGPMVLRRCRRLLGDETSATDAMHDVFVQLIRAGDRFDDRAPSALLYRMATNVCLNRLRTTKRRPETPGEELLAEIASLEDHESRSLAGRLLDRLFAREPASTRTIAVLHFVDGMTHEEVAAEVGMSVSGVRKRLRILRDHASAEEGANP
jgi:RNA polymerase sigma factor (sigma-70 family)